MKPNKILSLVVFSCDIFYIKGGQIWSSPIVSSSIRCLADNFASVGVVAHLSPDPPDPIKQVPYPKQYCLHPIPRATSLWEKFLQELCVFKKAWMLLKQYDVPYLRMFSFSSLPAALYCTYFFRRPWFMTLHGDTAESISISWKRDNRHKFLREPICALFRWLTRLTSRKPTILYTSGPVLQKKYAPQRMESIPFMDAGIREEDIYEERYDTCTSKPHELLFVGNMSPRKGLDILLDAVVKLRESQVPVKLTILGGGLEKDLPRLCKEFDKIRDVVEFGGYYTYGKPLFARMRQSDILVVPSRGSEGWNRVITECNAQGLPVIAADVNSLGVGVKEWSCGVAVPPENPDAIAAAVRQIIEHPEERQKMIQQSLARARHYIYEKEFHRLREKLEKVWGDRLVPVEQIPLQEAGR